MSISSLESRHLDGRRLSASRRHSRLPPAERRRLQVNRDELLARVSELDRRLLDLTRERRQLLTEAEDLRDALWPIVPWQKGRRPPAHSEPPVPPLPVNADYIGGRSLRSATLGILARHGETSLRDLHALLHHYGYGIGSTRPVQALADALAYEVEQHRAVRLSRGVYMLDPGFRPRAGRHGRNMPLIDPTVMRDPDGWAGHPGFGFGSGLAR